MAKITGYQCSLCHSKYPPDVQIYVCPNDGGNLDVNLDFAGIKSQVTRSDILQSRTASLWRYLPLLPVEKPEGEDTPLFTAGWTPVYSPDKISKLLGADQIWIKDESRNPTASFKDRASAVVVARAREIGAEVIVTASTGNAGAALAGMSAAVGQKSVIFAPASAPPAKIAQLLVYGAEVILVDGSYDDAFDLSIEASEEFGWYCRNTGYNPFTAEGKKTAAYEIWEWWSLNNPQPSRAEDLPAVFVSVGDGNIISGIHKGFKDLYQLGWIKEVPAIYGVQAEGSSAIANAFITGDELIQPVQANTLADSISVDLPRDGVRAVRAARETGGRYITVTDDEILNAIKILGQSGIFAEPAGATALAGYINALDTHVIDHNVPVVIMNTGSGLKDISAAMKAVPEAPVIQPKIKEVKNILF